MLKTINISFVSLALLAGFHSSSYAEEDVCLPQAAKMTAEAAAGLNAMVKLCRKATSLEVENSRKQIAASGPQSYPCAKDAFMKWYDTRFDGAMRDWSIASKAQQQQVCAGLDQFKAMSEELLKGLQTVAK
jgi:hypothetical protein